ncbi:MAG TPA: MFS transporter [Myxococcales bacterium]|nr:MFS transporter [Myxococcales bacterium]
MSGVSLATGDSRLLTRPFVLCSLSNFLQGIAFCLFLHLPGFYSDLGASPVVIGWMFAAMSAVAIGIRPFLGTAMDRLGRRVPILFGNGLNVVVIGLYLTVDHMGPWALIVRVLHGISGATLFTVLFTYAADWVPPQRLTEGLAIFGVSGMAPMSIGGILGDRILADGSYSTLFLWAWVFAVMALLTALPLHDAPRRPPDPSKPRGFTAALTQRDLLPLWWIGGVFFAALTGIFIFLKTFIMAREVGSVGMYFSGYTAVAVVMRLFLGWLPDRVGPVRVLAPALLVFAAGFLVLAVARSAGMVLLAGVLGGIGHAYTFPILFGMVVKRASEQQRGSAMAIFTGLADLGAVVGGPLFGGLLEQTSYEFLYAAVAATVGLGLLIFLPWNARLMAAPGTGSG